MNTKHIITLFLTLAAFSGVKASAQATDVDWLLPDSVVVNQFGSEEAWRSAAAVSSIKGEKLQKSFTQNVLNTLYGELTGLTVMSGSGEPGNDHPTLNARGFNTFDTSNRDVLIMLIV